MAFESLSDRFASIFKKIKGESRLTEKNMTEMLREIRIALLEADVNFKVVKSFVKEVEEKALGQDVYASVNPSQMIVKICHDEIQNLLGEENEELKENRNGLTKVMLVGLQGTGKTTTAGKLALYLKDKKKKKVLLCSLDVYRPAAREQLQEIANSLGVAFYTLEGNSNPLDIARRALIKGQTEGFDYVIYDTAGRLQIDQELMKELRDLSTAIHPEETLLLVDAAAGQDAVNVAMTFHNDLKLTGAIMSKLDGDAKGGSALSLKYMTGIPIKFQGVGEKLTDLEPFYPDRMADRILGMGDVVSLVEKAKEAIDEKQAAKEAGRLFEGNFDLEDMLRQMKMVQKIGSIGAIAKLIPGMPKLTDDQKEKAEKEMKSFEAIINSMTPYERKHPEVLKYSQKTRIAKGSGKTNADVNRVLKRFETSKQMMKQMKGMRNGGMSPFGGPFPKF